MNIADLQLNWKNIIAIVDDRPNENPSENDKNAFIFRCTCRKTLVFLENVCADVGKPVLALEFIQK